MEILYIPENETQKFRVGENLGNAYRTNFIFQTLLFLSRLEDNWSKVCIIMCHMSHFKAI